MTRRIGVEILETEHERIRNSPAFEVVVAVVILLSVLFAVLRLLFVVFPLEAILTRAHLTASSASLGLIQGLFGGRRGAGGGGLGHLVTHHPLLVRVDFTAQLMEVKFPQTDRSGLLHLQPFTIDDAGVGHGDGVLIRKLQLSHRRPRSHRAAAPAAAAASKIVQLQIPRRQTSAGQTALTALPHVRRVKLVLAASDGNGIRVLVDLQRVQLLPQVR